LSFGGGGSDVPWFLKKGGGFVYAASIDKYVYITLHQTFVDNLIIKYSKLETAERRQDIQHPIIREAFDLLGVEDRRLELTSMADIPAGTGLGSSGSFTTALLKTLHAHKKDVVSHDQVAREACEIELGRLKEPIGKQDQYIAAYGGVTCFEFHRDGSVVSSPLRMSQETRYNLEDDLLLFFAPVFDDQQINQSANDLFAGQAGFINLTQTVVVEVVQRASAGCQNSIHKIKKCLTVITNIRRCFRQSKVGFEAFDAGCFAHAGTCSGLAGAVVRLAIHITRCATASDKISGHMYMACTLVYPMASAAFFGDPPRRSIAFCLFMRHIVKQFTSAL
jgi:mevalonate kinase